MNEQGQFMEHDARIRLNQSGKGIGISKAGKVRACAMQMSRRQAVQLSILAALSSALPLKAQRITKSSKDGGSDKKGLAAALRAEVWEERLAALRCKWFYNWTSAILNDLPQGISYTPMIFKVKDNKEKVIETIAALKEAGTKELLGFNEPDRDRQADMTVQQALEAWPLLEESGMRLGSPAPADPFGEWMRSFMEQARTRKYRIDFVCVHSYGDPDPVNFINRLERIHQLHRKPIWITEFAVADWKATEVKENRYSEQDVLRFMEKALPKLDRADFVERYAWFLAGKNHKVLGPSALFDEEGSLTRVGQCYRDA